MTKKTPLAPGDRYPSTWGDRGRWSSSFQYLTDSQPLIDAIRSGELDRRWWQIDRMQGLENNKLSALIMALVMEGCTDIYPMANAFGKFAEACFYFSWAYEKEGPPQGALFDHIYSAKELKRCGSGPGWLTLSHMYGDKTARWGRDLVAVFAAVRQHLGEPLDLGEPTHRSHLQYTSGFFNWCNLYTFWPWGYVDKKGVHHPGKEKANV